MKVKLDKEFYERLLVSDALAIVSGADITDVYRDVASKEDVDTSDYLWVTTLGNVAVNSDDAVTDICFRILGVRVPQPRMRVFLKPKEQPKFTDEVQEFVANELIPYLDDLLNKYEYLYKSKFDNYQTRGKKGYLTYYQEWKGKVINSNEVKTSNSFGN